MEGFAALGIAANIFQVVDLSRQVLSMTREVYRTGVPSRNATLYQAAVGLQAANESLKTHMSCTWKNTVTKEDAEILDLAGKSTVVANRLLAKLGNIGVAREGAVSHFKALCDGLKVVWNQDKINENLSQLQTIQSAVDHCIMIRLKIKADDHLDLLTGLDTRTMAILEAVRQQMTVFAQQSSLSEHAAARRHGEIMSAIWSLSINPQHASTSFPISFPSFEQIDDYNRTADAILAWLRFPQMQARRQAIRPAHRSTFEWIFSERPADGIKNTGFLGWAREEHGIFWIQGKAGSGKSTLMKFISEDPRTHQVLAKWAAEKSLIFSSFYFWSQGNVMQKSAVGLLRSILYDGLKDRKELIPIAFPEWHPDFAHAEPTFEEVRSGLVNIIQVKDSRSKTCILIDGLDEFEGDSVGMTRLGTLLCELGKSPGIKIITASRPLLPFEESFRGHPGLVLQDLTASDIHRMVTGRLSSHHRFKELQLENPEGCERLIRDIRMKSSGVFLWVELAVTSILDGLQNHDNVDEMFRRLADIPPELKELFSFILTRIPRRYISHANRLLQIMHRWHKQTPASHSFMTANMLFFADDFEKHSALILPPEPLKQSQSRRIVEDLNAWLKGRCLGLLEMQRSSIRYKDGQEIPVYSVQFLHKAVPDYLDGIADWQHDPEGQPSKFPVDCAILEGILASMKTECFDNEWCQTLTYLLWALERAMHFNRLAEAATARAQVEVLDEIDSTMTLILRYGDPEGGEQGTRLQQMHPNLHWTHFTPFLERTYLPPEWRDNFLSFTILCGSELYVQHRLSYSNRELPKKEGRPLLDYAVQPYPDGLNFYGDISPKIVTMLLERGGDPNFESDGCTAWGRILRKLNNYGFKVASSKEEYPRYNLGTAEHHFRMLDTIEVLLQYGADPRIECGFGYSDNREFASLSAPIVLRRALDRPCPVSKSDCIQSINDCRCAVAAQLRARLWKLIENLENVGGRNPHINLDGEQAQDSEIWEL